MHVRHSFSGLDPFPNYILNISTGIPRSCYKFNKSQVRLITPPHSLSLAQCFPLWWMVPSFATFSILFHSSAITKFYHYTNSVFIKLVFIYVCMFSVSCSSGRKSFPAWGKFSMKPIPKGNKGERLGKGFLCLSAQSFSSALHPSPFPQLHQQALTFQQVAPSSPTPPLPGVTPWAGPW